MRTAATAIVVALTAINCGAGSERALLDQFFAASRLRDRTALSRFSTVVFEPRSDGIVEEFVVRDVTPARPVDAGRSPDQPGRLPDERQRVIALSLADPTDPVDVAQRQTVLLEKSVTVSARVGLADASAVTRSIVVILQRASLTNDGRAGRWIVVRFAY